MQINNVNTEIVSLMTNRNQKATWHKFEQPFNNALANNAVIELAVINAFRFHKENNIESL